MFVKLFKITPKDLYGKRNLEDFTTEVLAGLLRYHPSFAQSFFQMIDLPGGAYRVSTQHYFKLFGRPDCMVDLVLENNENICFLENKVESSEGEEQLDRYADVLSLITGKNTYLRYCTKYREEKDLNSHDFKQFSWHQIARLLRNEPEDTPLKDFYNYLKTMKMADNYKITQEKLNAAKDLQDTLKTFNHYLDSSKSAFEVCFGTENTKSASKLGLSVNGDNRIGYRFTNIYDHDHYNEIMYSVELDTSLLNVHLFIAKDINNEPLFRQAEGFIFSKSIGGIAIHLNTPLTDFSKHDDPTPHIREWYLASFKKVKEFLMKMKEQENQVTKISLSR